MKRIAGSLLLIWMILPLAVSTAAEMTLITEELAPFNYTENGDITGATTQVVREIARRLGIDDGITVMPWARGYQQL